ncbi:sigma-54-dependent Fis family transcriptional regulator [Pelagibius litoralis]|uniref:Sigma-54-dependent Fis family transcriptional regulator n=1 Tax=Pelagibius litoralis TaxID=374515 RepID=A0A967K958_9PROT|nr:response regulator [Pelagibius litoralis]NIA69672.1 sigma-54-dependent Fis family transcriptional regulator [Pelagibius litoralis]
MTQLLVIDDDEVLGRSIASYLERRGFSCHRAIDARFGLALFQRERPTLTIVDYRLGRECGLEVLCRIREENPEAQVVVMSGHGDIAVAVEAMKRGARDFLTKPAPLATIAMMAAELVGNQCSVTEPSKGIGRIIGRSDAAIDLRQSIKRLAAASGIEKPPSVLISGEQGLAKAKVAAALHEESPRRKAPFVVSDCAASFSSATEDGSACSPWSPMLEKARGGTLLLKNIAALDGAAQAGLLYALESGLADDVWVLATSSDALSPLIRSGAFSADLLYRIQTGWVDVPALRERSEDILPIAAVLTREVARKHGYPKPRFTPKARKKLLSYPWLGNIMELRNCLRRAVLKAGDRRIDVGDIQYLTGVSALNRAKPDLDLQQIECSALQSALQYTEGNVSKAADLLGITRDTLRYRMSKFGLSRNHR